MHCQFAVDAGREHGDLVPAVPENLVDELPHGHLDLERDIL